jgi:uncharacterized membrane protein
MSSATASEPTLDRTPEQTPEPRLGDLWSVVLGASLAGIGFTVVQVLEKITLLKNPGAQLVCDFSERVSCSDVLDAWQSSVLGPPNSVIGAIMFSVLASGALAGFLGTRASRSYVATLWGLAVFFLAFATWFMAETAFSIRSLCPWCIGITTAVVVIAAALTRIGHRTGSFGDGGFGRLVARAVERRLDLALWGAWWLVIGAMLLIGLS